MDWAHYETQVYTALLGKIAGVYFGRPVEGWHKTRIQQRFGPLLDHYCAAELNVPLIVVDDDISGTVTFIRTLEDSGLYGKTPQTFFGDTWLNYLIECKTILWWGGMAWSTEHTAYLRLKNGIKAPASGSMALNGKVVSEQIGAQIFIDAFGMVAPGDPRLAAELAEKAARVSHDGEAVYAAQTVAAMVAAAFTEKDMNRLLDTGVSVIPADCLIAQIHRDVRSWAAEDGDWEKTYARIEEKYGYHRYGGGCHVVPNHAVMVMAWAYGQQDFYKTMQIVTTAGWDTDCNAANVGTVTALAAGSDALKKPYDFLTPFSDRIFVPTADGTTACCDVANEACRIAAIGRKIAGMEPVIPETYFHFSLPGSVQGFMPEQEGTAENKNGSLVLTGKTGDRFMRPCLIINAENAPYQSVATPLIYPGIKPVYECDDPEKLELIYDIIRADESTETVTELHSGDTVKAFGFRLKQSGSAVIRSISLKGTVHAEYAAADANYALCPRGWINSTCYWYNTPEGSRLGQNEGRGVLVTGNRYWSGTSMQCQFKIHAADCCGLIIHYQGTKRYTALEFQNGTAKLVRHNDEDVTILQSVPFTPEPDTFFPISLAEDGKQITADINGIRLETEDHTFSRGGCGFFAEMGVCFIREVCINAQNHDTI